MEKYDIFFCEHVRLIKLNTLYILLLVLFKFFSPFTCNNEEKENNKKGFKKYC